MTDLTSRLQRLPTDARDLMAFFTRLPVSTTAKPDFRLSGGAWPLAGLLIALGPAALLEVLRAAEVPPLAAAALALAALAALSGGLHEDGLADTADGLGGGADGESKLAVMADSRLGTFGALALLFTALAKVGALAALSLESGVAAAALIGAAMVSRALALWHWSVLPAARADGLAAEGGQPDGPALLVGTILGGIAVLGLLILAFGPTLFALALAALAVLAFNALCRAQIGGHTGDTVGAAQQIAETLLLVGLSTMLIAG